MLWLFVYGFVFFILGFIILYQLLYFFMDKTLFEPSSEHVWIPDRAYQEFYFGEPRLHGWYFPGPREESPVILFCHGNRGNMSQRQTVIDLCREMRLALFIYDYRGYGYSRGRTKPETLLQDGEAAYTQLRKMGYSPEKIIVWGESLGGLVAVHVASKYPCARLILMATFCDLAGMVEESSGLINRLIYYFLRFQGITNQERIKRIKVPILVIHSQEDDIIPYQQGEELYKNITHNWKKFITIQGCHIKPIVTPEDVEEIMRFCWQAPEVSPACLGILDLVAEGK